jgi:hypothetical protein
LPYFGIFYKDGWQEREDFKGYHGIFSEKTPFLAPKWEYNIDFISNILPLKRLLKGRGRIFLPV